MEKKLRVVVAGGDTRQVHLCQLLEQDGHQVRAFALDRYRFETGILTCATMEQAAYEADCAIFPMPMTQEGRLNAPLAAEPQKPERLLEALPGGCIAMGGMVPENLRQTAARRGNTLHDYLQREELARMNAAITAEGAIQVAMENTEQALLGSRCLVVGYGRIGSQLAARLRALGARVTATARQWKDLAQIRCDGMEALPTGQLERVLPHAELVFNTAPALVLPRERLALLPASAVVIDLASKPGGAGFLPRGLAHALRLPSFSARVKDRESHLAIQKRGSDYYAENKPCGSAYLAGTGAGAPFPQQPDLPAHHRRRALYFACYRRHHL